MEEEHNIDYLKEVSNNIAMAKILSQAPEENRKMIFELLQKQNEIRKKNGWFAETKIMLIDKKIKKMLK